MKPDLTEDVISMALRTFLLAVLPDGIEVVLGQVNRVPEPASLDHVIFTPSRRTQLSTTAHHYEPSAPNGGATVAGQPIATTDYSPSLIQVGRSNSITYNLDIYGPNSTDNAQVVATLFRDEWGCSFFAPYGIQPLYSDDGHQMPLVNGEYQYEDRWTMTVVLQANPYVSLPMQFADSVHVDMHKVN